VRAVRLKNKVETLGDVVGLGNLEGRPRNGHVADQAINQAAGELAPDINTGLRGIARLSMKPDMLKFLESWAHVLSLLLLNGSFHRTLPKRTELVRRFIDP
jgi:hypothetical protein